MYKLSKSYSQSLKQVSVTFPKHKKLLLNPKPLRWESQTGSVDVSAAEVSGLYDIC